MALARWVGSVQLSGNEIAGGVSVTDVGEDGVVVEPPVDLDRGTVLAGRYQVEAYVGKGGSGVVLRAFDRITQTLVALKVLSQKLATDPHWAERFSRELRLGRQIQHPNVCRVFDIGEADGHRFLSMELATKGTLRDWVQPAAPPRPFAEKVADARALVSGLAALHAAGIIHRDVKPENLLRMEDGRVVLSDFGLATNSSQTAAMTVLVGTPSYMAPEIVMGDPASFSSDVWALGVTMHEILFGKRPEWDVVDGERVLRTSADAYGDPAKDALTRLCATCSAERAEVRPATAGEVLSFFELAEQGRSRRATASRASTDRRRRRVGWGLLAVAAIVAITTSRLMWTPAAARTTDNKAHRITDLTGVADDWSVSSSFIAKIAGKVHCVSLADHDRKMRIIWGEPRVAEDVDLRNGERQASDLISETFARGCPQASPVKDDLLFEKFDSSGRRQIFLSPTGDGADARPLTQGSEPIWLRNGSEFAYSADDAHAAIFSLPVMSSIIVDDGSSEARSLIGKFISPDGAQLATRYVDPAFNKIIVIHRLPSLEVISRLKLNRASKEAAFGATSGELLLSYEESGTVILADLKANASGLMRLGTVPGAEVRDAMAIGNRVAFMAHNQRNDIWMVQDGKPSRQLTFEGRNYHPDLSTQGDLLVESVLPQGEIVVKLYPADGAPARLMTSGPVDLTPSFLPDGDGWLYVRADRHEIVRCSVDGSSCDVVHAADVLPIFPVASPDGRSIAYLSAVTRARLFVWSSTAGVRDLGPARMDCAPRWSTADRIWVLKGADDRAAWVEVFASDGKTTGRVSAAGPPAALDYGCPYRNFPAIGKATQAADFSVESSELRVQTRPL